MSKKIINTELCGSTLNDSYLTQRFDEYKKENLVNLLKEPISII